MDIPTTDLSSLENLERAVNVAEEQWRSGKIKEACALYTEIAVLRLECSSGTDFGAADLFVFERLADLALLVGQYTAAQDILKASAQLCEKASNATACCYLWLKSAHFAVESGDIMSAERLLKRSLKKRIDELYSSTCTPATLAAWETSSGNWSRVPASEFALLWSRFYGVLGALFASNGQYHNALVIFNRALFYIDSSETDLVRRARVPLQLACAAALLESGNFADAEKALDSVRVPDSDVASRVRRLELKGQRALLCGELGTAIENAREVLALCRQYELLEPQVRAALNLAQVQTLLNQTAAARKILEEAWKFCEALKDPLLQKRVRLWNRVRLERVSSLTESVEIAPSNSQMSGYGRLQSEKPHLSKPEPQWETVEQAPNFLQFFYDRILEFRFWLAHDAKNALNLWEGIENSFAHTESKLIRGQLDFNRALLLYYLDRYPEAEQELSGSVGQLEALGLLPDLWQALRVQKWCREKLGRATAPQDTRSADEVLDKLSESLSGSECTIFLLNKWTAEEEFLARDIGGLVEAKNNLSSHFWKRWWEKRRLSRETLALAAHIDNHRTALANKSLKKSGDAQGGKFARLSADRASLSFLVLPDLVLVIVRTRWSIDFAVCPVTRGGLREGIAELHKRRAHGAQFQNGLAYLGEKLQLPQILGALPARVRKLTIVPDDVLHGLPFAMLRFDGGFLVERFALTIESSLEAKPYASKTANRKSLLVGVSHGARNRELSVEALRQVEPEIEEVERWLHNNGRDVQKLLDEPGLCELFANKVKEAGFLHLACHGFFNDGEPDASGVLLEPTQGLAGVFTLRQFFELELEGLQHATLASCWSADNFIYPGRWIISLPETLRRRGVGSVLGCLWDAPDQYSFLFLKRFYKHLAQLPRDEALQRTQLEALKGQLSGVPPLHEASLWANYVLYGEHGKIAWNRLRAKDR